MAAPFVIAARPAEAARRPPPERVVHLVNPHTDEAFRDVYWARGRYLSPALRRINWLMRDFHIDKTRPIDPRLVDLLCVLRWRCESRQPLEILSGYRSTRTNEWLQEEGLGAAPHSMHLVGRAADIRIPGVSLAYVRRAALTLRAGGVGYYPHSDFVHVDTGPVRTW